MAYREGLEKGDPHEEIVRLEERIEELAATIESCRKFILASRIAVAGGGPLLAGMLFGAIRSDLGLMQRRSRCCSAALLYGVQTVVRKRGDEGASRIRVGARSSDRTHQSACHFIAKRRTDVAD